MNAARDYSTQLVTSGTYQYPLQGLYYLCTHQALWPPVTKSIVPSLALTAGVLVFMFTFTYIPQVAVLALFNGPLAVVNAVGLVLSESSFLINLIARAFIIDQSLIDLFDATLIEQQCASLVSRGRELKSAKPTAYARLGKMLASPLQRFSPKAVAFYVATLPLNLIPIVGTAVFILLQGRQSGPRYHARYFQLKGFTDEQRADFVKKQRGAYTGFGTVATLLNLVPMASIPFAFSDAVGAALWAAQLEKSSGVPNGSETPSVTRTRSRKDL